MSFLAPAAFLLAALLPVVIAMYLLRLRRSERLVSSVYLWQRMVRDVEANAPWQRLRRNLLMILQLLFLAALIFSLARPFTWAEGAGGAATIIILDTSASMAASDVSPSRLEAAKNQAQRLVEDLPAETRLTLIEAGDRAQVLLSSSQDRRQAIQAIADLQVGTVSSDLAVALQLASAVAARQPGTDIVVLSDGGAELPTRMALTGTVRYLPIGIRDENQAISLFNLDPAPGGETVTAFIQVINYGSTAAARRLALFADGDLYHAYDLDLPAGGERALLVEGLPAETRLVEAQLQPSDQGTDHLETDDRARAVQRTEKPAQVIQVSQGNRFLETALGLLPGLALASAPPNTPEFPPADLTIFDATVPITAPLPAGNLLFIAPTRSTSFFTVTGLIEAPIPLAVDPDDPLLNHVPLEEVSILDSARIPLPTWARPVVVAETPGVPAAESPPLLFAGEINGRRIAVLAFDLRHSDLPLQVGFPILLANLTQWLAPGSGGSIPTQFSPGAALSFATPPDIDAVRITRPDGSKVQVQPENGRVVFADTEQLGLYAVDWGQDESLYFTVNLFSPQESSIGPVDSLPISGGVSGADLETSSQARREWWRALAFLALALLVIEWLVYQRSTLALIATRTQARLIRR